MADRSVYKLDIQTTRQQVGLHPVLDVYANHHEGRQGIGEHRRRTQKASLELDLLKN